MLHSGPRRVWNRWHLFTLTALSWGVFFGAPILIFWMFGIDTTDYYGLDGRLAVAALAAVTAGYYCFARRERYPASQPIGAVEFAGLLRASEAFVWLATPVALALSVIDARNIFLNSYLESNPVSPVLNYLGYVEISLIPIFLWSRDRMPRKRYWLVLGAICIPRLIISLFGPRFFVLQALLPIFLWESIYFRMIKKRHLFSWLIVGSLVFLYVVPNLRGDEQRGLESVIIGSPVGFRALARQYDLVGEQARQDIILCEITANSTGYDVCALRKSWHIDDDVRPRIDQAATANLRDQLAYTGVGTGGNPIVEAFPQGVFTLSGICWFLLIGASLGLTVSTARNYPIACFLFPHLSAKCAFLWRGTICEYFDRIPMLILSFIALLILYRLVGHSTHVRRAAS